MTSTNTGPVPSPLPRYVYKIIPEAPPSPLPAEWPLSDLDRNDGFIHLSTAKQARGPRPGAVPVVSRRGDAGADLITRSPSRPAYSSRRPRGSGSSSCLSTGSPPAFAGKCPTRTAVRTFTAPTSAPRTCLTLRASRGVRVRFGPTRLRGMPGWSSEGVLALQQFFRVIRKGT